MKRYPAVTILAACLLGACAANTGPGTPAPAPLSGGAASPGHPTLRLLELTPRDGTRVDSSSVITATVAYHIPTFDPNAVYRIAAVFAGSTGGSFNRGGGDTPIRGPAGIVTIRHSLDGILAQEGGRHAATPLTGTFFLLEQSQVAPVEDTMRAGEGVQIRVARTTAAVRSQTRTFFYNGAGPARSFSRSLMDQLEEYWRYRPHKAIAIAHDSDGRSTYGYGYGFPTREAAVDRALRECRASAERRSIRGECVVVAVDDTAAES